MTKTTTHYDTLRNIICCLLSAQSGGSINSLNIQRLSSPSIYDLTTKRRIDILERLASRLRLEEYADRDDEQRCAIEKEVNAVREVRKQYWSSERNNPVYNLPICQRHNRIPKATVLTQFADRKRSDKLAAPALVFAG